MHRSRSERQRRAEQGSALIIALVFLVVFAMLAGVVAQLATTSLRVGDIVSEHSDTLFGADDAAARTQVAIEQNLDPVCEADATIKPYVHNGDTYLVRCSYLREGENPLPGIHFAMMLFSKDPWALTKVGGPSASLTGSIRLNTDKPCFRYAPDGYVPGIGIVPCANPPDESSGMLFGKPTYSAVGPIRFRADSEGNQGTIDIRKSDCSGSAWVPSPVDMASAVGGPHLQNANKDGSGPYTSFTASNWTCHSDDLVDSDPNYPMPDQVADGTLPTQDPAGTYENCGSTPQWFNVGYPVLVQYNCVRHFTPGRYTSNPRLDLTASYGYLGRSTGVRANVFDPGVYWFDSDAPVDPTKPWFPEPGLPFTVGDTYHNAPVVMGTADTRIRAQTTWTNADVVAQIPIDQRCLKGQPGVEMVFNPGYGMWVNPVTGGAGLPSAQVTACQLRPGQVPGGQPGIVLYQKKYPAAMWDTGFTGWPAGYPSPWPWHPAFGTFALFNSADNVSSGGLVMDGFIYAPHGIIKTAVGLVSTTGTQIASGIIAFALQLKAVGPGGQMVANEQPRFSGKYLVEIWNCGAATDAATCGIATKAPDARALVNAAVPGGTGPTPIRFDRWLPN